MAKVTMIGYTISPVKWPLQKGPHQPWPREGNQTPSPGHSHQPWPGSRARVPARVPGPGPGANLIPALMYLIYSCLDV